ncbi:MAG: DUF2325 domain-containing protein [Candidatus Tectimicrobiota bacterium]
MLLHFLGRRKIWTMSCESLVQILASSLLPDELLTLCRKYDLAISGAEHEHPALYQLAHKQCHHAGPFARQVQRLLDRQHALALRRFAALSPEALRQTVTTMLASDPTEEKCDIASVIWAVASDPRPAVRPLEQRLTDELHWLSYGLLLAQWRQNKRATRQQMAPVTPAAALPAAAPPSHACHRLAQTIRHLEQREQQLLQANACLQKRLQALQRASPTPRPQPLAPPPGPSHGQMARELRKLHYEVGKLQTVLTAREAEIRTLQALVTAVPQPAPASTLNCTTPTTETDTASPVPAPHCLGGRTIAIIGGLDTGTVHYTQLIQELGGDCLHHDGFHNPKKLAEVIRQADIVLCPIDRNSHAATLLTKKICRAMHKSCYFLRSSGLSSMRSTLRDIALQA